MLTAALDTVQPVCMREGQTLVRPASGLEVEISADPAQLERALVNVLANAAKYTPRDGRVTVTVSTRADRVEIAATDSGIGIPPHQIERWGEQFFRADSARGEPLRHQARARCHQSGGRQARRTIADLVRAGAGSRFTLSLPIAANLPAPSSRVALVG